jgi:xyloglucan 6-xylosyltransferase
MVLTRGRQLHKTFNNTQFTILYSFVTIPVLCRTINICHLSSSNGDIVNQNIIEETNRILTEIRSDSDPNGLELFFNPNDMYTLRSSMLPDPTMMKKE